jgi:hypothetical protein
MSGLKLSVNNGSLRSALHTLKETLAASLGEKCPCADTIVEMENAINSIERKLSDLLIQSPVDSFTESFAPETQAVVPFSGSNIVVNPQ